MKKAGIAATLVGVAMLAGSALASAQTVKGIYWTTSGMFGPFPITGLIPTVPKEKQRDVTIPVSMWIIDHPKGLVVFDTGNNVAVSDGNCKSYWAAGLCDFLKPNQKRSDVIDEQLKKVHRLEAQGQDDTAAQQKLESLLEKLEAAQQKHQTARRGG